MAKIIRLDTSRKRPKEKEAGGRDGCEHKNVVVYQMFRTVRCAYCGTLLDPFDVLLDMVKGYVPAEKDDREESRFVHEDAKRKKEQDEKERK